jgi:mono/diheme cytochrome c family protein
MRALMEVLGFLAPWLLIGLGVIFVAFSGGPARAREAYLTRGRTVFRIAIPLVYIGLGVAIPAVVLAARASREGNSTVLSEKKAKDRSATFRTGRTLFRENCAACHNLDAVNARGITGPDLDKIGAVTPQRVLSAIKVGGTGQNRMPANLVQGDNAKAIATFVSAVAGK